MKFLIKKAIKKTGYAFFFILFFLLFYFSATNSKTWAQENNNQNKDFLFRYYVKMGDQFYHHHYFQTNLQLAFGYYKKALELDDSQVELYWKISRVLWVEQEKTLANKKKNQLLEEALRYIEKGLALYPQNLDIRLWSAIIKGGYVLNQNFVQAILFLKTDVKRDLEFVLSQNPKSTRALFALGSYYSLVPKVLGGNIEKGIQFIQEAIKVNPNFHRARIGLAEIYLKNKQYDEAIQILEPTLKATVWEENGYALSYKQRAEKLIQQAQLEKSL